MVQCNLLFKKRRYLDKNDMDFVMDPIPIGIDSQTDFPLYREIDHVSIVPQPYLDTYKLLNTVDDYGLFTEFLIRPGVRKIRQENVQLTVEQKENTFKNPAFLVGFFGFRPGFYDAETQNFQAIYDYFLPDRNSSMMCDNTFNDLASQGPTDVETLITEAQFAPTTINEYEPTAFLENYDISGMNGSWVGAFPSVFPYSGPSTFDFIKVAERVYIENLFAGMNITPDFYDISHWEPGAAPSNPYYEAFTCNLDTTAYPQGWIRAVEGYPDQPDAFFFAGGAAVVLAGDAQITIHNTPAVLGIADGVWTAQAHPTAGSNYVQLVGHTPTRVSRGRDAIRNAMRAEFGITGSQFTFYWRQEVEYKQSPVRDAAYITPFQHTATVTHGNHVFTSHNLISPLFNHVIDSAAFPPGIAIQAKLVIYIAIMEYEDSDTPSPSPVLTLLPADNINSFAGTVDLI